MLNINNFDVESCKEQFRTRIDIKTACKLVGLCYMTFCAKFQKDKIRHAKIGRKPIFDIEDISNYILLHKSGNWVGVKYSDEEIVLGEKIDLMECSKLVGVNYNTFYSIMRRENLPCFKYDNKRVFLKIFIQEWFNSKLCMN